MPIYGNWMVVRTNENGRRMKENEIGLDILNCVWDGLNEATW